jgi:MFS transporter, MHS family, proline/betaine transporter
MSCHVYRPLGAIVFGEMGDRWIGRKNALVFSIVLITVPSVTMGLLPGYNTWGPVAPLLLVVLRMMQGLSVGGQLAGSYVLCIEQSSPGQRGFRGSVCDASSVGGFLLASAVTSTVRYCLTQDQVRAWGWRLPFWFSLLLAPLLVYIVGHTEESKFWEQGQQQQHLNNITTTHATKETGVPQNKDTESVGGLDKKGSELDTARPALLDLLDSPFRRRQLVGMIGVLSATTSSFYILFLWVPVYLSELRGFMSQADADLMNFIVVGCHIFFLLAAGKLSDMFPHRTDLMKIGLPGIIVGCPAMFGMFESQCWWGYLLGQLQFGVCLAMIGGSVASWNVELWMADPTLSYTGVAIGHNTAATIFGGTMPLIATALYYCSLHFANEEDGDNENNEDTIRSSLLPRLIPGFYVSFLGIISLVCITFVIRHPHDVRTGGTQLAAAVGRHNSWKYKSSNSQASKRERRDGEYRIYSCHVSRLVGVESLCDGCDFFMPKRVF